MISEYPEAVVSEDVPATGYILSVRLLPLSTKRHFASSVSSASDAFSSVTPLVLRDLHRVAGVEELLVRVAHVHARRQRPGRSRLKPVRQADMRLPLRRERQPAGQRGRRCRSRPGQMAAAA